MGAFPALNARPVEQLDDWLSQLTEELQAAQTKIAAHAEQLSAVPKAQTALKEALDLSQKAIMSLRSPAATAVESEGMSVSEETPSSVSDEVAEAVQTSSQTDRFADKSFVITGT